MSKYDSITALDSLEKIVSYKKKYAYKKAFLKVALFLSFLVSMAAAFANHQKGLHLQFPDSVIDMMQKDIDQCLAFPVTAQRSNLMIKLKPQMAAKLSEQTSKSIGQTVLWIYDGHVLAAEKLKQPLTKDLTIPNFPVQEVGKFCRHVS